MHTLRLAIFGQFFEIRCSDSNTIEKLRLDFYHFITDKTFFHENISILIQPPPWHLIPAIRSLKQNESSIIYEKDGIRFNDYHGKALSIVDYNKNESHIYTTDHNLAHELGYLLILSRSGKKMDLAGFHKIHAMGIQYKTNNLIFISPSKGGKSTHFLKLLEDPEIKIFSDDTPIVDRKGNIYSFPLRVGIEHEKNLPSYVNQEEVYKLERRIYGTKTLIPLKAIKRELAIYNNKQKIVLVVGIRTRAKSSKIVRVSSLSLVPYLFKFLIIGVGLPMILEYFLESGFLDLLKRVKIILSRSCAMASLLIKSDAYIVELNENIEQNTNLLRSLIKNN